MDSEKVIKRDNEYVLHTYNRNPIVLEKGHGLYAEGPEGQKYLDFTSGIGVNSLGYCDLACLLHQLSDSQNDVGIQGDTTICGITLKI